MIAYILYFMLMKRKTNIQLKIYNLQLKLTPQILHSCDKWQRDIATAYTVQTYVTLENTKTVLFLENKMELRLNFILAAMCRSKFCRL